MWERDAALSDSARRRAFSFNKINEAQAAVLPEPGKVGEAPLLGSAMHGVPL